MTCQTDGRDITSLTADAKRQIAAKVTFPKGLYAVFYGHAAEATAQARRIQLLMNSVIAAGRDSILLLIIADRQLAKSFIDSGECAVRAWWVAFSPFI